MIPAGCTLTDEGYGWRPATRRDRGKVRSFNCTSPLPAAWEIPVQENLRYHSCQGLGGDNDKRTLLLWRDDGLLVGIISHVLEYQRGLQVYARVVTWLGVSREAWGSGASNQLFKILRDDILARDQLPMLVLGEVSVRNEYSKEAMRRNGLERDTDIEAVAPNPGYEIWATVLHAEETEAAENADPTTVVEL